MPKSLGLLVLLLSSDLAAQCIPATGTALSLHQDSISGPQAIGFAFPIFGATYTDIHVSDHGICFLSNGGAPATPTPTPLVHTPSSASLVANGPVLCPFWSDTIPGALGTFFIDAQASICTITWVDVQSYGFALPLMTFQMKLFDTGQIEFIYGPNVTNNSTYAFPSNNGVVGVSPGTPAILPGVSDLSAGTTTADETLFEHFLSPNTFDMGGGSLLLTPTNPGWIVFSSNDGASCAFVDSYGIACHGLQLTSTDPILGEDWDLTTTGINPLSVVGFTFFSFGRANPSLLLSAFGQNAPGCWGHLPPTVILTRLIGANLGGTMTVTVSMPQIAPWLIGESFTNQTFAFTDQNPAGIASSNGIECTMGR